MVKVGFELLAELDKRIAAGEKKQRELFPCKEAENYEEQAIIHKEASEKIKALKKERATLKNEIHRRNEPEIDPRIAVREKAKKMNYQNSIYRIYQQMVFHLAHLQRLSAYLNYMQSPGLRSIGGRPSDNYADPQIASMLFNYSAYLGQIRPLMPEDIDREMVEAEQLIENLRQNYERQKKAAQAAAEF